MFSVFTLDFSSRFMEDLQAEVQEMEFLQFSKGMDTMRREDFAEWLLHYTNEEANEAYWENMRKRIPAGQVKRNVALFQCFEKSTLPSLVITDY